MKRIEIVTSHNITIVYSVATAVERFLASFLDGLVIVIYAALLSVIVDSDDIFYYLFIFPVIMFYHFLFEVFNDGQSIGKWLLKIKVVSLRGRKPEISDLFLRWIFRMVDITLSLGMVAVLSVLSTLKSQRIGDIIAHTTVINLKGSLNVNLDDIERISYRNHEVKFKKVTRYTDKDMLLVKDVINRFTQDPNMINRQIALDLSLKIKRDLGLGDVGMPSIEFLNQILNDYIILTR